MNDNLQTYFGLFNRTSSFPFSNRVKYRSVGLRFLQFWANIASSLLVPQLVSHRSFQLDTRFGSTISHRKPFLQAHGCSCQSLQVCITLVHLARYVIYDAGSSFSSDSPTKTSRLSSEGPSRGYLPRTLPVPMAYVHSAHTSGSNFTVSCYT